MTDIVYILGPGSKWNDNELKYSIRSIIKHVKNYGTIWAVGFPPRIELDLLITFIPVEPRTRNKNANIREALRTIALTPECTEKFVYMNDDFFFTKDVDAGEIPNYTCGTLGPRAANFEVKNPGYWRTIIYTWAVLAALGYSTRDYEVHGPILMEKDKLILALDLPGSEPALQIRSIYANVFGGKCEIIRDCKLGTYPDPKLNTERALKLVNARPFFSIGDELTPEQKEFFDILYPCNSATFRHTTYEPAIEKAREAFNYTI